MALVRNKRRSRLATASLTPGECSPQPHETRRSTRAAADNANNFLVAAVQLDEEDQATGASEHEEEEEIDSEFALHRRAASRKQRMPPSRRRSLTPSASQSPEAEIENRDGRRYPSRIRATKYRFDPVEYDEPPAKRRRPTRTVAKARQPVLDEGSNEQEDEDEDADCGGSRGDDGGEEVMGIRYSTRDRTRKEARYSPPKEEQRERQRIAQAKAERRFRERMSGGSMRRHHKRPLGGGGTWSDSIGGGIGRDWFALPDSAAVAAAGGAAFQPAGPSVLPGTAADASLAAGGAGGAGFRGNGGAVRNVEVTPVEVDSSLTFDQIGGLDGHVDKLKEMIFLPLTYPELFERFHISPPRGMLFYGPPGTGKTLVARALAAQASTAGKKVTFFMRKGADILSKWVGEAERVLRMLFAEAERCQPSIIFFDEIDGLAPIRSSKQDQIHNSIVSTLLALMDGLTSRGQVVVIGATNRPDALDAALRRPGRFDRELLFPLPNVEARDAILEIHTRGWKPQPNKSLRSHLAVITAGYCGADLKALCTEASLVALRRCFPQIYDSNDKLVVDPGAVKVLQEDFKTAFRSMTPASGRAVATPARLLSPLVVPCLQNQLDQMLAAVRDMFPAAAAAAPKTRERSSFNGPEGASGQIAAGCAQEARVLLCGPEGGGQSYLGPALLAALEALPVHSIGLPSLLSDANSRSPEEAVVHAVVEARRAAPAVLFLPHLQLWWSTATEALRATLWMLLSDLPPTEPLLLVATADVPLQELDQEAVELFRNRSCWVHEVAAPDEVQRAAFFKSICDTLAHPPPVIVPITISVPPRLPRAPNTTAEAASAAAAAAVAKAARASDVAAVRSLRIALREGTTRLLVDRRWRIFAEPVSPLEDPEYANLVSTPMDLATLLMRVDQRRYGTLAAYVADLQAIPAAASQYWAADPRGAREVSRAHALVDEACAWLAETLPPDIVSRTTAIDKAGGLSIGIEGETDVLLPMPQSPLAAGTKPWKHTASKTPVSRSVPIRETRATRQEAIDPRVIFNDPEAQLRRSRQMRRVLQQTARSPASSLDGSEHDQLQQQKSAQNSVPAADDGSCRESGSLPQQSAAENGVAHHAEEPEAAEAEQVEGEGPLRTFGIESICGASHADQVDVAHVTKESESSDDGPMDQLAAQVVAALEQGVNIEDTEAKGPPHETFLEPTEPAGSIQRQSTAINPEPPVHPQPLPVDPADVLRAEAIRTQLVAASEGLLLSSLEDMHIQLVRVAAKQSQERDRDAVVKLAVEAIKPICR